ncbi:putative nucleotidyltransferase substrate binding protein [Selenomonas ruminantium subsp. lactilytica TAM6421]|uniref:Putative nucleotidyltransferase substrate binding protein n=1 Tax=Selenomonas ruminantium subsp. lactilytica (strain NBRC 103574 / TAM6421) TaxID=927704 RepID=I0GUB2_SELRL|nr:HI0074 family nucleotidyltransferase substrate-binding subunit [Selenomonas ruminantium]BAL84349.1 putative nucleotidyltransferase substrate binding protein [Selenomonas ruminantium subsp. lactilytica TAM6421]
MKKYDNFCSNLHILSKASEQDLQNEFIISGIIDKFFVQFELGWKLIKELIKYEGRPIAASGSPRTIIKEAYKIYDFFDEDIWLEMLDQRNDLTHIYDGKKANELVYVIMNRYIPEFQKMEKSIKKLYGSSINDL